MDAHDAVRSWTALHRRTGRALNNPDVDPKMAKEMEKQLGLAVVLAVPIGMISAVYRYSALDYATTVTLGWLPSSGMLTVGVPFSMRNRLLHLLMPSIVLATFPLAQLTRYVRSSMVDALAQDYVRTARAKGLPEREVLGRHALRNALIPMGTVDRLARSGNPDAHASAIADP